MTIQLTHANLLKPVKVAKQLVFGVWYSDSHKATLVLASGGAMLPVTESVDEVNRLLTTTKGESENENH